MRLGQSSTLGKSVFWTFNRLLFKFCMNRIWSHMWYFSLHQLFKPIVSKNRNMGSYSRWKEFHFSTVKRLILILDTLILVNLLIFFLPILGRRISGFCCNCSRHGRPLWSLLRLSYSFWRCRLRLSTTNVWN